MAEAEKEESTPLLPQPSPKRDTVWCQFRSATFFFYTAPGLWAAFFAALLWLPLNSAMQLTNSLILRPDKLDFTYPLFLTFIHRVCTLFACASNTCIGTVRVDKNHFSHAWQIVIIGVLSTVTITLKNMALVFMGLSTALTLTSVSPAITMVLAISIQGKVYSKEKWMCVVLIVAGCFLTMWKNQEAPILGILISLAAVLTQCLWVVLSANLLQDCKVPKMSLLLYTSIPDCIGLFAATTIIEGDAPLQWIIANAGQARWLLVLSGIMAFLYNCSQYLLIQKTSAITVSVLAAMNRAMITMLSIWYIEADPGWLNAIGIIMSVVASIVFGYLQVTEKTAAPAAAPTGAGDLDPTPRTPSRFT